MFHTTSPRTDDAGIETMIQFKGKTAPRVTPAGLEAVIASEHYFTAADGVYGATDINSDLDSPLRLLTFCVLVLKNGFTVTGESACASPDNFDAEIGRKIARENAKQNLWPLLGYELKSALAKRPDPVKRYEASDLAQVQVSEDSRNATMRFAVTMFDGAKFLGEIDGRIGTYDSVIHSIIEWCNQQAPQTN